jgi:replicative DNA helicase
MAQMIDRPLPHSAEAERAIVGSVMLDNGLLDEAERLLKTPQAFYVRAYQLVFTVMLALRDANDPIDPITISEELRRRDSLEQVGGMSFIAELTMGLPMFSSVATYCSLVNAHARRRWLISLGSKLTQDALEGDSTEEEIVDWFDAALAAYRERTGQISRGVSYVPAIVDAQVERFRRFFYNESDAVPTGFPEIDDNVTGRGLMRSMLHLLAGRPSAGKTSLALDITANVIGQGLNVYFASLEMSKEVLLDRLFAVQAGVARWKIQPGIWSSDFQRLEAAAPTFREFNLFIDDRSRSGDSMRRAIRDIGRSGRKVDLVVLDYLQLMDTSKGSGSRNDKVGENSRHLQALAKETGAPVLALSQLSRAAEQQQGGEPELHHLRDSGELEQDARSVYFLFGDKGEEDLTGEDPSYVKPLYRDITLKCAKQGEGKLFRVKLPFQTELMTFRPVAQAAAVYRREEPPEIPFGGEV